MRSRTAGETKPNNPRGRVARRRALSAALCPGQDTVATGYDADDSLGVAFGPLWRSHGLRMHLRPLGTGFATAITAAFDTSPKAPRGKTMRRLQWIPCLAFALASLVAFAPQSLPIPVPPQPPAVVGRCCADRPSLSPRRPGLPRLRPRGPRPPRLRGLRPPPVLPRARRSRPRAGPLRRALRTKLRGPTPRRRLRARAPARSTEPRRARLRAPPRAVTAALPSRRATRRACATCRACRAPRRPSAPAATPRRAPPTPRVPGRPSRARRARARAATPFR